MTKAKATTFIDPRQLGLFKPLYDVPETCAMLAISRNTLYRLINNGMLKASKLGVKKTVFLTADLVPVLQSIREGGLPEIGPYKSPKPRPVVKQKELPVVAAE